MTKTKAQLRAEAVDSELADILHELRHYADDVRYDYNAIDDVYEPDEHLGELCARAADAIEGLRDRLQAGACEKRIEQLESLNAEYMDINHEQGMTVIEQGKRIAELEQRVEDMQGMLGELPPEGKCAMLLVKQVGGEYIWACERYDFASYILVDSEAGTFAGMTLNDPFERADFADKQALAQKLRRAAADLDRSGDVLGVMDAQGERIGQLESLVRDMWPLVLSDGASEEFERRMAALGLMEGEGE